MHRNLLANLGHSVDPPRQGRQLQQLMAATRTASYVGQEACDHRVRRSALVFKEAAPDGDGEEAHRAAARSAAGAGGGDDARGYTAYKHAT